MSLARKLAQKPKKKVLNSEYKVGDLVYVFGFWEGKVLAVQRGKLESIGFRKKRVETNTIFYKIKYKHEWMDRIKTCIGLYEKSCLKRRKSIWK